MDLKLRAETDSCSAGLDWNNNRGAPAGRWVSRSCYTGNRMKMFIWIGIAVGGTIGGWIGAAMTHGNWMSGWSMLLSAVGSLIGIWAGYKLGRNFG